jgi:hypothetical protein
MKKLILIALASAALITGCNSEKTSRSVDGGAPGSERDQHGCIASAGYAWCARINQCERPWELAEQQGFDNTEEAFRKYCNDLPPGAAN